MHLALLMLAACFAPVHDDDDGSDTWDPADDGGGTDDSGWWSDGGGDDGGSDGGGDDGGTDDGGDDGTDSGWWNDDEDDVDGDGWTSAEGDCDDSDEDVNPGERDDNCNGVDEDCSGTADDDFDGDDYEPNDSDGHDLGSFGDEGEELILAYIHPEDDEDRYLFYVEDAALGWFDIELWLYDVPDDADYKLQLVYVEDSDGDYRGIVETADDAGRGGDELVNYGGETGFDDSGWYEAVVTSNDGYGCTSPYTLQILVGSW